MSCVFPGQACWGGEEKQGTDRAGLAVEWYESRAFLVQNFQEQQQNKA